MTAALRVLLSLVLLVAMVIAFPMTTGVAEPTPSRPTPSGPTAVEPVSAVASALAVAWPELGLSDEMTVQNTDKPQTVTVPIPAGVKPAVLTGQLETVANVINGRVDVFDGRHTYLGSVALSEDQTVSDFTLDLANAVAGADGVQLDFYLRQEGQPADTCARAAVKISQLVVTYSGEPAVPTSVADFLPRYLNHITVRVGHNPSADVQQSALTLVAYLTHLYHPIPVRIDVDTSDDPGPPPADPLGRSRAIAIREDANAGLAVVNPGTPEAVMVISGQGDALRRQVELFADRRFEVAQTASADVMNAVQFAVTTGTVKTFGDLKMTGQSTVVGTETLYLGFDASQFGVGAIESAEIDLIAKYSPVVDAAGSVVLRAGQAVIGTHILDQSGTLELKARIPADAIQSDVGLSLEIRYIPRERCLPRSEGILFAIQPQSTVQVQPGTQTRRGFSVLPMAFVPEFNVAVNEPDKIRYAAAAINLMGQKTTVALRPRLVSIDEGVQSNSGLLIVTSGDDLEHHELRLPMLGSGDEKAAIHGDPMTDIDLKGPLGVIQTATTDKHTVLAISAVKDWALVDRSFDYIWSIEGKWGSLDGDVVATGAQGKSVNMTIDQGGGWQDLTPDKGWIQWALLSIGIGGALVIAGGVVLFVRWRRARRGISPDLSP